MNLLLVDKLFQNSLQIIVELKKYGQTPQITRIASDVLDFLKGYILRLQNQSADNKTQYDAIILNTSTIDTPISLILKLIKTDHDLEIPLILIVPPEKETEAIVAIRAGAFDYLFNNNLQKLGAILERELREKENYRKMIESITAQKESEKRYCALWETSKDLLLWIDRYGNIQSASKSSLFLLGYEPVELTGKHISILQPPNTPEGMITLSDAIKNTASNFTESCALHKNGNVLDVEISQTVTQQNQSIFLRIRDVSELKYIRAKQVANQKERNLAAEVQKKLYPIISPQFWGFDIAGYCYPAEGMAGDYYDFNANKQSLSIGIGDVSGHGIASALLMSEARAYLKAMLLQNPQHLDKVLTLTNKLVGHDMGPRYITVFLLQLFRSPKMFCYANAGHIPGYLIRNSEYIPLQRTGIAIGRRSQREYFQSDYIPLSAGDAILLLTDGVEELPSKQNPDQLFGSERILKIVRNNLHRPASEVIETIYEAGKQFAGIERLPDDFTAVIIKTLT